MAIEYAVRPVIRYFVTRFEDGRSQGAAWNTGSSFMGAFDGVDQANRVCAALAASEDGALVKLLAPNAGEEGLMQRASVDVEQVCRAQTGIE